MSKKGLTVYRFFSNPVAVFVYSFLFTLVAVLFTDKSLQVVAIIIVGVSYTIVSFLNLIWNEKVSAKDCRDRNIELEGQLRTAQTQAKDLLEKNVRLEAEIPQVIHYSLIRKEVAIKDNGGSASFKMTFEGANISPQRPINRIRHIMSLTAKEISRSNTHAWFNGEEVVPQLNSEPLGRDAHAWRTELFLETTTPVLPKEAVNTCFETSLADEYKDAFDNKKKALSSHQVALSTDKLCTEITAPKGYVFHPNPDVEVKDVFTALRVPEEENRIVAERALRINSNRTKVTFDILCPRISYEYRLLFNLQELSKT